MEVYEGKWELLPDQTTGFDDFSTDIGAPMEGRETLKKLTYIVTYSQDGVQWKVKAEVKDLGGLKEYVWTPGKEFSYEGLDGSKMKSTITWNGSQCDEKHASEGAEWTSQRLVEGDIMTVTSVSKNNSKTMVQKFKRQ